MMKIAKEIALEITPVMEEEIRIPPMKKALDECRAENESIIAAKLKPVREALEKAMSIAETSMSDSWLATDSRVKAIRDALALLSEEE